MVKISVIMPVYNTQSDYFNQAVNSVLSQSIEDFELIIINDGSTIDEIIKQFNSLLFLDNRIKILNKPHEGSGLARNLGIAVSNGETISFLDSDDYYPDGNTLEVLYETIKSKNVYVAGGFPLELKEDGSLTPPYFNYGDINEFFSDKEILYSQYQFPWWYWCFLYDSNYIKSNNFFFPDLKRYQDPIWFVNVMNSAEKFYALKRNTYIHRDRGSLHTLDKTLFEHHIMGIVNLLKYSDSKNLIKLHNLLYSVFFSYDVTLFKDVAGLTCDDEQKYISMINSVVNKDKLYKNV